MRQRVIAHEWDHDGYEGTKSSLHFAVDQPLPSGLVRVRPVRRGRHRERRLVEAEMPPSHRALESAADHVVDLPHRGATEWAIEEVPNASAAQLQVRQAWLSGRSS